MHLTLTSILEERNERQPAFIPFQFITPEKTNTNLSINDLHRRAHSIALHLQSNVKQQDRVLILLPPGFEFICAMYACMIANVIAVPAYPPITTEMSNRIINFIKDADIKAVLVDDDIASKMKLSRIFAPLVEALFYLKILNPKWQRKRPSLKAAKLASTLNLINIDKIKNTSQIITNNNITPESIAYIQYTSGSTSNPKGVVIKHKNLLANFNEIQRVFKLHDKSIVVSWLPPFHDMGLITNVLMPIFSSFRTIQMAPFTFIQNPSLLLETVSKYKGTVIGGPDFGFRYCVDRIPDSTLKKLDLSSLEVIFSGAEKIQIDTLKKFAEKFAPCKLKQNIYLPCYGMAESTLLISGKIDSLENIYTNFKKNLLASKKQAKVTDIDDIDLHPVVSVGPVISDIDLLIIDEANHTIKSENEIGEICIRGNSVTDGYWQNVTANKNNFIKVHTENVSKNYLRTGDLGFIHNGELYIVGRVKELIIIAGKNHYPQDIELTVELADKNIKTGAISAFSVEKNQAEQLILVGEVKKSQMTTEECKTVVRNIKKAVAASHLLEPYEILLVKRGDVPKTTSGKIKRVLCKKLYEENEVEPLYRYSTTE